MAQELERVSLAVIAREWGRIGCIGFGGPPAHIALLRTLCVRDRRWLTGTEFEDGVAVCNLLPGPASTQLAIYCAWRLRGTAGALVGGLCFIVPGLGRLVKAHRKARMGRNPQTGEPIQIKAKTVVKFRVAKATKDAIAPKK